MKEKMRERERERESVNEEWSFEKNSKEKQMIQQRIIVQIAEQTDGLFNF